MNGSPPELRVRIGVGIEVSVAGLPVRLSRFQQALLFLLSHAGAGGVAKESIFRLLWDSPDDPATRHRLRQLSYNLNRLVPASLVRADREVVRIVDHATVEWLDGELGAAIAPPTQRFADRVAEITQERKRLAQLGSARELDAARLADAPEAVIESLRTGPRTTGCWRDLLWALLRTGRMREAEIELRRVLGEDMPAEGIPSIRRIATERDSLLSLAAGGGSPAIPLIGRDRDVRRLHGLLVAGAQSILVTGASGVGRSRILGQAVATLLANRDDSVILSATGTPFDRHTPFGGLSQLLSDELLSQAFAELGQPETEVIRRALPTQFQSEEPHTLAEIGGPGSYLRVARAVTELFQRAYGNAEVLLVIDDMEVIDRSSFEVVVRLIHIGSARLLATWCTEGQDSHTELLLRLHGLDADLVPLGDLDLPDAASVVQSVASGLSGHEAEDIARISGGRPGRIIELVRALGNSPLPRVAGGPTIDEILRQRVAELTDGEQQVLVYLCVSGGQLGIHTLGQLMRTGVLESAGLVRGLEAAGLARIEGDHAAVAPALLTHFVSRELPSPIHRDTHAAIAEQLLREDGVIEPGSVAHHLLEADRPREAAAWFRRAGFRARDRTAYAEAILFLEKCVMANEGSDPDVAKQLGLLHSGMGDFKQAIHWYHSARTGYVDRGDEAGNVEVVLLETLVRLELGESKSMLADTAKSLLRDARRLAHRRLIALALDTWLTIADYGHHRTLLAEGLAELLKELDDGEVDPHLALVGTRLTYLGLPDRALALARRAYLRLRTDPDQRSSALRRLVICLFTQATPQGRRASILLREAERLANASGDLFARFSLLSNQALWCMDNGAWNEAARLLDSAQRFTGGQGSAMHRVLTTNRAVLAVRRGRVLDSTPFLDEMEVWMPTPRKDLNALYQGCRLVEQLERGRLSSARVLYQALAEVDPEFPFSSDLAIVPLAMATYLSRVRGRAESIELLEAAAKGFAPHNRAAVKRIRERLVTLRAQDSRNS